MFVKLPQRIINLNRINQVECTADGGMAMITWASGDAPTYLTGQEAIALLDAIEHLGRFPGKQYVDASFVDPFIDAEVVLYGHDAMG